MNREDEEYSRLYKIFLENDRSDLFQMYMAQRDEQNKTKKELENQKGATGFFLLLCLLNGSLQIALMIARHMGW